MTTIGKIEIYYLKLIGNEGITVWYVYLSFHIRINNIVFIYVLKCTHSDILFQFRGKETMVLEYKNQMQNL